ncbi:MAG: aromatic acid exporter family protein [Oscillospiraceae bacterium]|nr:aromatic acid exporter family protein [Oscillospiraceae bacterium]
MKGEHCPIHAHIPGFGQRSIKTALAATLIALIYVFAGRNPTFACIGVIFGLGSDLDNSWLNGGNRLIGTVIGGFLGIGLFWLEHQIFPEGNYFFRLPILFLGIMALVAISVLFHWPGAVQPGGVVLCIILFNTPAHHIAYALDRMLDTGIGVVVALAINLILPRERLDRWLHLAPREDVAAPPSAESRVSRV